MPSRRDFLQVAGPMVGLSFAGCISETDPRSRTTTTTYSAPPPTGPAPHVGQVHKIWNDDDRVHAVVVTIRDGKTVLASEEYDLQPGAVAGLNNPVERQGRYTIRVELDGHVARTATWLVASCENYEYLQVYVGSDGEVEIREKHETIVPPPTCETTATSENTF